MATDTMQNQNDAYQIYIVIGTVLPFLIVAYVLRMWVKYNKNALGLDDYFMTIAVAITIVGDTFDIVSTVYGLGRHFDTLSFHDAVLAQKYAYLSELFAILSVWSTKQSICSFILRIIDGTHKKIVWSIWALIVLNFCSTLVTCILWGIQARPITALWDPDVPGTHLAPSVAINAEYATASLAVVTDVFCSLSPLYFLRSLRSKRNQKVLLLVLMAAGLCTSVTALLKTIYVGQLATTTDVTWGFTKDFVLSCIEKNVGAFLANLPVLRGFFFQAADFSRRTWTSLRYSGGSYYGGTRSVEGYEEQKSYKVAAESYGATASTSNDNSLSHFGKRTSPDDDRDLTGSLWRDSHMEVEPRDVEKGIADRDDPADPTSPMGDVPPHEGKPEEWFDESPTS